MLLVTRRAKMPLYGVLPPAPIKSRRAAKNAVQTIYIKYGNTKQPELYAVQRQQEKVIPIYTRGNTLLKVCHAVTKWLQLSGCA